MLGAGRQWRLKAREEIGGIVDSLNLNNSSVLEGRYHLGENRLSRKKGQDCDVRYHSPGVSFTVFQAF